MLTTTIEKILNRGLPRSPRARQLCGELKGARLGVEVRGMTRLIVHSTGEALVVIDDGGDVHSARGEISANRVRLHVRGHHHEMEAYETEGEERQRLFDQQAAQMPIKSANVGMK